MYKDDKKLGCNIKNKDFTTSKLIMLLKNGVTECDKNEE